MYWLQEPTGWPDGYDESTATLNCEFRIQSSTVFDLCSQHLPLSLRQSVVANCLADFKVNYINGLVQERRNSSALAMELRLSCTNPSKKNVTPVR